MISMCCWYTREGLYKDVEPHHVYSCIALLNECALNKGPCRVRFVPPEPTLAWTHCTWSPVWVHTPTEAQYGPADGLLELNPPCPPSQFPLLPLSLTHPPIQLLSAWLARNDFALMVILTRTPFRPLLSPVLLVAEEFVVVCSFVRVFWHCDLCHGLYLLPENVCPWVSIKNSGMLRLMCVYM